MAAAALLADVLRQVTARLADAGVGSPQVDAAALLAFVLETDSADVHRRALLGHDLPVDLAPCLAALVDRRCAREPLQHLTGIAGFRRLTLAVGPGVFVPRPETEIVVDLALQAVGQVTSPLIVDLCTGSGALALALADEISGARVHAVELSEAALAWARRNAASAGLPIALHHGDATGDLTALADVLGRAHLVVSNPPYIPPDAVPVDPEVALHDPQEALYGGGEDGLDIPRGVIDSAARLLAADGTLIMEHADVQSNALVAILSGDDRWQEVAAHDDLTGRPRAVSARRTRINTPVLLDCRP